MKALLNLGISFAVLTSAILYVQKKNLDESNSAKVSSESLNENSVPRQKPSLQISVPVRGTQPLSAARASQSAAAQNTCSSNDYYTLRAERKVQNWSYCRAMRSQFLVEVSDEYYLLSFERVSDPALNIDYKMEDPVHVYDLSFYKVREKNPDDRSLLFSEKIETSSDYVHPSIVPELSQNLPAGLDFSSIRQHGYWEDNLCRNIETQEYERVISDNLTGEHSGTIKVRALLKLSSQKSALRIGCQSQKDCECRVTAQQALPTK